MTTNETTDETRTRIHAALIKEGVIRDLEQGYDGITQNAQKVLDRRYLAKDREGNILEDNDGMFRRVAHNLAQADLNYGATPEEVQATEDKFFNAMRRLETIPNSPTLMNAGRELQQLSACFVLPVDDTIEGIFESVKQTALIHKSGGGTGFSFSRLRPSGDMVGTTGGVASGPVSFIRAFDTATDVVKQGGTRRGANMAILRVDHPDILEFIRSKEDGVNLSNFNISVAINHNFMEKAHNNQDYQLMNPHSGKVAGTLNAKEVFEEIVRMAWETGDPGIVFLDRINRDNPNPQLGEIESTNPCFAGSVRLATDRGLLTFQELHRRQMEIQVPTDNRVMDFLQFASSTNQQTAVKTQTGITVRDAVPVFKTRTNWPLFQLTTKHGYKVTATEDHKFYTNKGLRQLGELEPGDTILIQSGQGIWSKEPSLPTFTPTSKLKARVERGIAKLPTEWSSTLGQILGWILADGWLASETPQSRNVPNHTVGLTFGTEQKKLLAPGFQAKIEEWLGMKGNASERNQTLALQYKSAFYYFLQSLGFREAKADEKEVPESIWAAPRDAVIGFLSAMFTADGTVNISSHGNSCSIRLSSSSKRLLQQVQLMLLNEGIVSKIYHRRDAGKTLLPDSKRELAEYNHKSQYEIVIDGQSRNTFLKNIGFLTPNHQNKALEWGENHPTTHQEPFTDTVESITYEATEDVYCTTEGVTHSVIANGFVTAQCGEQPLLPNESCNLASINLVRMLRHDRGYPEIDWEALSNTVSTTVHMLDNVIDMNNYPLAAIEEMSRKTRRIGVGVMGFSDVLIQMGIPYDSEQALEMAGDIMKFIQEKTHESSGMLTEVRGNFPAWEESIYGPNGENKPMRNSAPVTIAPTGTISIIAGASSGIEPLFALSYVRDVMDHTRLVEVNPYLEAVARHEGFYSEELMEQLAQTGTLRKANVPDWVKQVFQTSQDISPTAHVKMQAVFQRYTDNSVSKTINFAHDATIEDVRKAYLTAYNTGCKGVTVYRDGSKAEQVLSTGQTQGSINGKAPMDSTLAHMKRETMERPGEVYGVTERLRTGHGNMYVTLNFDEDGHPFELFSNLGKAGGCDSAQLEAISRLISLAMRSNIDVTEIIHNLKGITCCPSWDNGTNILSAPDALAISLDRHLKDGHFWGKTTRFQLQAAQAAERGAQAAERAAQAPSLIADSGPTDEANPTVTTNPETKTIPTEDNQERELYRRGLETAPKCPDCNTRVIFREGCMSCPDPGCGWNKCD